MTKSGIVDVVVVFVVSVADCWGHLHLIDSGILGIAVGAGNGPLPAAAAAPATAVEVAEEFLDRPSELDVDDAVEDSVDAEVEQVETICDVNG